MSRQPDLIQHRVKFADDPKPTDWRDGDGTGMYPDVPEFLTIEVRKLYVDNSFAIHAKAGVSVSAKEAFEAYEANLLQASTPFLSTRKQAFEAGYSAALSTKLQEPVGEVVWYDPALDILPSKARKIIDASIEFMENAPLGTKLYASPPTLAHQPVTAGWEKEAADTLMQAHDFLANAVTEDQIWAEELDRKILDTLAALKSEKEHLCPICAIAFNPDDICASDIDMGICHAACLEGSPTVNLDTGEPSDGPIATYRYDSLDEPVKSEGRNDE